MRSRAARRHRPLRGARGRRDREDGWRERYAEHSLHYENLETYFYLFSVWDAQNVALSWDDTLEWAPLSTGFDYGALTTLVVLEEGRDACARRNRERDRRVPDPVLERQFESAQFPYADEAHEVWYVRADEEFRSRE